MNAANRRVSFAELELWPEDNACRYELYDGEVIVVPVPVPRHQRVTFHIGDILREYERTAGGLAFDAPIDLVLTEYDVIQPDLSYFREERKHVLKDERYTLTATYDEHASVSSPTLPGLTFEARRVFAE